MRFFELVGILHFFMYLLPGLLFIILFGLLLGYSHFSYRDTEQRKENLGHRFPEGFQSRNSPFPTGMALIIIGTVLWAIVYILLIGLNNMAI